MIVFLTTVILLAHDWYPKDCCGEHDCRPVPCEEIHAEGNDLVYKGYHWSRKSQQVRSSPDGSCAVCITVNRTPICVFLGGMS